MPGILLYFFEFFRRFTNITSRFFEFFAINAVKNGNVYELDPKLWYFSDGSTSTTIKQFDELNQILKKSK